MWVAQWNWAFLVKMWYPEYLSVGSFKVPKLSATFIVLHVVPFFPFISWCYLVGTQIQTIPQHCLYAALQDVCLLCLLMNRIFRLCSVQIWSVLFSYGGMPDHLMFTTDPVSCNLAISCRTVLQCGMWVLWNISANFFCLSFCIFALWNTCSTRNTWSMSDKAIFTLTLVHIWTCFCSKRTWSNIPWRRAGSSLFVPEVK